MLWVIHVPILFFLGYSLLRSESFKPLRRVFPWAISYKVIITMLVAWFNYSYVQGDSLAYLHDLQFLNGVFSGSITEYFNLLYLHDETLPASEQLLFFNDQRPFFFLQLVSPFFLLIRDYWLMCLYLGLLSFLGNSYLVKKIIVLNSRLFWPSVLTFFFYPSFVFWSSGLMKEPVALFAMVILISIVVQYKSINIWNTLLFIVFSFILFQLKYYYAATLLPFLLSYLIVEFSGIKKMRTVLAIGIVVVICLAFSFLHPNLNLASIYYAIKQNYFSMAGASHSIIEYNFGESAISLLPQVPKAFFSSLFRPFLGFDSASNMFIVIAMIENGLLLALAGYSIYRVWKKSIGFPYEVVIGLMYVLLSGILIGFSCSNFGTLSRYRIGYSFVFLFILLTQLKSKKNN